MVLITSMVLFVGGARNLKGAVGDELGAGVERERVGAHRCELQAGTYLRLIDSCITQLKAQGPYKTGFTKLLYKLCFRKRRE